MFEDVDVDASDTTVEGQTRGMTWLPTGSMWLRPPHHTFQYLEIRFLVSPLAKLRPRSVLSFDSNSMEPLTYVVHSLIIVLPFCFDYIKSVSNGVF